MHSCQDQSLDRASDDTIENDIIENHTLDNENTEKLENVKVEDNLTRKFLFENTVKMFMIEEGTAREPRCCERLTSQLHIFKWFVIINIVLLVIFCFYALCSLYLLENAMRVRESIINLEPNITGRYAIPNRNDTRVIPDFHEWRKTIMRNLENMPENESKDNPYNLKFLLNSITSVVKNMADDGSDEENAAKHKLVTANLTDFEIHILKEFTKLRSRIPRTVKGDKDESKCDLKFTFDASYNNKSLKVRVLPAKIRQRNFNVNTDGQSKEIHECAFNIVYDPNKDD